MSAKKEKKIGQVALKREFTNSLGRFLDTPSLNLILEMNDPIYCERRAIELIRENELLRGTISTERAKENIQLALCILGSILVKRGT